MTADGEAAAAPVPAIPPFRIEIRNKGEPKGIHWTLFAVALSENQKDTRLQDYRGHFPDWEFRGVANEWADPSRKSAADDELDELRKFRKDLIAQAGTDDIPFLAKAAEAMDKAPAMIQELETLLADAKDKLAALENPAKAAADAFKYPFEVGDSLKDEHSGIVVTVTAIGADTDEGDGFDFEYGDGAEGHCPLGSIQYYEKVDAPKKPVKKRPKKKK
jgi:hypothetical protein